MSGDRWEMRRGRGQPLVPSPWLAIIRKVGLAVKSFP